MNKKKILIIVLIIGMVLFYDLIPVDLIPDLLAGVGQIDDVGITLAGIAGVLATILSGRKKNMEEHANANNPEGSYREI